MKPDVAAIRDVLFSVKNGPCAVNRWSGVEGEEAAEVAASKGVCWTTTAPLPPAVQTTFRAKAETKLLRV